MIGKNVSCISVLVIAVGLLAPALIRADPLCDCPGSSYSPCHYNFPLLWNLCSCIHFHRHAAPEAPPPFNDNYYDYRSHCPYAAPAVLSGVPSITQRSKLAAEASPGQ